MNELPHPPLPRGKVLHLLLWVSIYFCGTSFMMQFPRYIIGLGGTAADAGNMLALALIPALLLGGKVGAWNQRFGGRLPGAIGCLMVVVANLAMVGVSEIGWPMFLLRFLYGVGHSIVFVTFFAQGAMLVEHPVARAKLVGWLAVIIQVGNAIGGTVGELAFGHGMTLYWGWCGGIGSVALGLALLWSVPPPPVPARAAALPAGGGPRLWPQQVWPTVAVGMAFSGLSQFLPAFIAYLGSGGGLDAPFAAAWFITPALLVVAVVRLVAGRFTVRLLKPSVLLACHGLLVATLLLVPWMHNRAEALALALLFGLGYGWLYPALNTLAFNGAAPEMRGRVAGWMVAAFEVGFRLGPIGLGVIIGHWGYRPMFAVLAVGYVVFVGLGWLRQRQRLMT